MLLDAEALKRASTIYLPTKAVRMLPERLSTDLASLKKGVDRPAFTAEVRFDSDFNRIGASPGARDRSRSGSA